MLRLIGFVFFLNLISSPGFAQRLSSLENEEVKGAVSDLRELEKSFGYNDYSLVEPLSELAIIQTTMGSYVEANRSIDRAIQLIRRTGGLYTRDQLPYLRQKIENLAASGDWGKTRDQMEHINWFYLSKSNVTDVSLVNDLLHLSGMHLHSIAFKPPDNGRREERRGKRKQPPGQGQEHRPEVATSGYGYQSRQ